MEIGIFYSKANSDHLKAATFVKKAVENLGISATITEWDTKMAFPKLVVDGFDYTNLLKRSKDGTESSISYDLVEKALERFAW